MQDTEVVEVEAWIQQSTPRKQALMVRNLSLQGWTHERADAILRFGAPPSHREVRPQTAVSDRHGAGRAA